MGQELIAQLQANGDNNLRVLLIANSKKYLSSPKYEPLDLRNWKEHFDRDAKEYGSPPDLSILISYLQSSPYPTCVVDCTASDNVPSIYPRILECGISVVTPNKKGLSGQLGLFHSISKEAAGNATVYYESTVGAGLPIISTLQDLVETGDQVSKIEGIFSGTLSYIFNDFGSGTEKFSQVVKIAKEKGYTEPDPRDDLNGMDVARKLTILARTIGLQVEGPPSSSIFPIESLIPAALESARSGDEFLAGLPAHDAEFDEKRNEAKKSRQVLRYVGGIDVATQTIKVGLQRYVQLGIGGLRDSYPVSHPFASLQGSDNIIAFHTKRYGERPLIVQGAGYFVRG